MFAKLLKHEFKSQAKLFLILSIAALIAGAVGGGMLSLFIHLVETETDSTASILGAIFSMLVMMFMIFAVVAYVIAVMIILVVRFYKHHFSDEGYLTFTLPASGHQLLLSSICNILIWQIISSIVAIISAALIMIPVFSLMSEEMGMTQLIFNESFLEMMYSDLGIEYSGWYAVLRIFSTVVTYIGGLMLMLTSVTIGSVIAKKHKILASIGIYYGINMAMSILTSILSFAALIGDVWVSENIESMSMYLSTGIPAVLYLVIAVGGYFLMHHLVSKKLNLP